jgi:hypothetical protein
VTVAIEAGDGLPQRRKPERGRVGERAPVHHLAHRVPHGGRGAEVGLADAELDDPVARGFERGGLIPERERVERLDALGAVRELHGCLS